MRFIACVALVACALCVIAGLGGLGGCKSEKQLVNEREERIRTRRVRSFQRARARDLAQQRRLAGLADAVAPKPKVLVVPVVSDGGVVDAATTDASVNDAPVALSALIGDGPPLEPHDGKPDTSRPATVAFGKWDRLPKKQRQTMAPVVNASTSFTLDLLGDLARRRENISLAPWSLWSSLVTLASGATGTTRKELRRLLHLSVDDATLRKQWTRLNTQHAQGLGLGGMKLRAAKGLWVHRGVNLRPAAVKRGFGAADADLRRVDFKADPEKARQAMNLWIGRQVGTGPSPMVGKGVVHAKVGLLVTSAVALSGPLGKLFPKGGTIPGTFYLPDCKMVQAPMMRSKPMKLMYSLSKDLELVDIPLAGGALSLTLMMAPRGLKLATFQAQLTSAKLRWWFGTLREAKGDVTLPRLDLGVVRNLAETLRTLGLQTPFSKEATFGILADPGKVSLETVLHRTSLVLRESGAAVVRARPPRPTHWRNRRYRIRRYRRIVRPYKYRHRSVWRSFYADRPFLMLLRHRTTGAILYLARIYNPAAGGRVVKDPDCIPNVSVTRYPYHRARRRRLAIARQRAFLGRTTVIGGLDGDGVRKIMQKHKAAVAKCVKDGKMAKPPLKGRVGVRFAIRSNGTVGEVHLTFRKRRHARTGACLGKLVKRWKFGKNPAEPTVVGFTVGSFR